MTQRDVFDISHEWCHSGAGQEAYPDGCMYQYQKFGEWFLNSLDRLACQTITDRGIAMIPLPTWGRTFDRRMNKKKDAVCVQCVYWGC